MQNILVSHQGVLCYVEKLVQADLLGQEIPILLEEIFTVLSIIKMFAQKYGFQVSILKTAIQQSTNTSSTYLTWQ